MIRCIVVDDERRARELLVDLLENFIDDVEVIGVAESASQAKQMILELQPDLLFLDVEMPKVSGLDLLKSFSEMNFEVVLTTGFSQYAIEAIKKNALDYLLKPISVEELKKAVDKFKAKKVDSFCKQQKILLPINKGYKLVDVVENVVYCESYGNYTKFFLMDEENPLVVSKHLKFYEEALHVHGFIRIHDSYLINLQHFDSYIRQKNNTGIVVLSNNVEINVSRNRRSNFLARLKEHQLLLQKREK